MNSIYQDWRSGMPYDELHTKYGPWNGCECDACDAARAKEREEDEAPPTGFAADLFAMGVELAKGYLPKE